MAETNGHGYVEGYSQGVAQRTAFPEERQYGTPDYTWERPIGEMFQELADDARKLINLEVTLAKTELSEKASQTGKAVGFMAAGGFIIYAGFLAVMFAVILGLSYVLPPWLSALIVGVVVALVGYILVRKGQSDLKTNGLAPQQTIQTLKEDKDWVQNQVR